VDYFLALDQAAFLQSIRPALRQCWLLHNFTPARELCQGLLPAVAAYQERFFASGELLVRQLVNGLSFNRLRWRHLTGEVLLFAAAEIPEVPTAPDTFCCLLAPDLYRANLAGVDPADASAYLGSREQFAPIQQALWGSRDLTFGPAVYRPDAAGVNLGPDVRRLAEYLQDIRPEAWTSADLAGLRGVSAEDREEELAYARECFTELVALYQRLHAHEHILVLERIY
jgi:hypothetical protein